MTAISAVTGLFALETEPQAAAQAYWDCIVGPVRGKLPDAAVSTRTGHTIRVLQLLVCTMENNIRGP